MKSNIINKLTIQLNEQLYNKDEIYLTVGIKFGFCIDEILVLPQEERKKINQASGAVLIEYIKIIMKEKYEINVKGNTKTGVTYISMNTKKYRMDDDVRILLKTLYEDEVNEEAFNRAKEMAKRNLSNNYKNVTFRAYNKMMEFSNINKSFSLSKLTKSYLDIDVQAFEDFFENVVILQNSILFINGDLSVLDESKIFNFIENIKTKDIYVLPVAESGDKYLQTDMHLIDFAKENITIGGINFNFFNEEVTAMEKQLLLSILNEIMFKDNGQVLVDEFDNSLLYFNLKLDSYSTKTLELLSEENVLKAKNRILYKLAYTLNNKPFLFNKCCIDLYGKRIDCDEYYDLLNNCDCGLVKEIYTKGNLKITECHLLYKKEG